MNGKGNQGAFLGKKEKEGEGGCGTDRGGMKGKGTIRSKKAMENVKIMQEKEDRDGREVRKY